MATVARYSRRLAGFHWTMAAGTGFLMGTAYAAGQIENDPQKTPPEQLRFRQKLMWAHESVGLCMLGLFLPRLLTRLRSVAPAHLPVPAWQRAISTATHTALYGALAFMPLSGLGFGYLSGWGVPLFWLDPAPLTAAPKAQIEAHKESYAAWEKFFYDNHHRVGNLLYYIVPLHVGGALFNAARGLHVFKRMSLLKH